MAQGTKSHMERRNQESARRYAENRIRNQAARPKQRWVKGPVGFEKEKGYWVRS